MYTLSCIINKMYTSALDATSVIKWLRRLAPLRWGSNPMRGSCQLLTKGCWFTLRNKVFLHL